MVPRRGTKVTWGVLDDSPVVVNWSGLSDLERTELVPTLLATNNWILLTPLLGSAKSVYPPFPHGARRIFLTKGNASREKHWWTTGEKHFVLCLRRSWGMRVTWVVGTDKSNDLDHFGK